MVGITAQQWTAQKQASLAKPKAPIVAPKPAPVRVAPPPPPPRPAPPAPKIAPRPPAYAAKATPSFGANPMAANQRAMGYKKGGKAKKSQGW